MSVSATDMVFLALTLGLGSLAGRTEGTNIVIGRGVSPIILNGDGQEADWTYAIDPTSSGALHIPVLRPRRHREC